MSSSSSMARQTKGKGLSFSRTKNDACVALKAAYVAHIKAQPSIKARIEAKEKNVEVKASPHIKSLQDALWRKHPEALDGYDGDKAIKKRKKNVISYIIKDAKHQVKIDAGVEKVGTNSKSEYDAKYAAAADAKKAVNEKKADEWRKEHEVFLNGKPLAIGSDKVAALAHGATTAYLHLVEGDEGDIAAKLSTADDFAVASLAYLASLQHGGAIQRAWLEKLGVSKLNEPQIKAITKEAKKRGLDHLLVYVGTTKTMLFDVYADGVRGTVGAGEMLNSISDSETLKYAATGKPLTPRNIRDECKVITKAVAILPTEREMGFLEAYLQTAHVGMEKGKVANVAENHPTASSLVSVVASGCAKNGSTVPDGNYWTVFIVFLGNVMSNDAIATSDAGTTNGTAIDYSLSEPFDASSMPGAYRLPDLGTQQRQQQQQPKQQKTLHSFLPKKESEEVEEDPWKDNMFRQYLPMVDDANRAEPVAKKAKKGTLGFYFDKK